MQAATADTLDVMQRGQPHNWQLQKRVQAALARQQCCCISSSRAQGLLRPAARPCFVMWSLDVFVVGLAPSTRRPQPTQLQEAAATVLCRA